MAYTNIDKPTDYFNTKLYSGNGSTQSISSVGFQPDWTWIKGRSGTYGVSNHKVYDVVRGATKTLFVNLNNAETTQTNTLTSFDSDGFSLGNDTNVNASSTEFVSWNWYTGATASSNTDGSITSSVSANTTAGFSIVSYTGTGSNATVGHGLGAIPKMIILKERNPATTRSWRVYNESIGNNKRLLLDSTTASTTDATAFNSTSPTSSVFSLGTSLGTNSSGKNYIAYCFADVKGYLKVGSYTGNGSTDGTFVYTGHKPAWVMVKRTNTTGSWIIFDNKRNSFNPEDKFLYPNLSNAEGTLTALDFVSNGFKFRNADTFWNASGSTYIYMAFAENPFTTSTGIPACAR